MAVYYPYGNCSPTGVLPPYACSPCTDREYARIRSIAFYKESSPFTNIASAAEWTTKINAGNAIIIYKTSGSYDGGETEELPGFGDNEFDNGNTTHSLTFRDAQVFENADFYDSLKNQTEWVAVYRTSSKIWNTGETCNIKVKTIVSDNIKEVVVNEVMVKWVNPTLPKPYTTPDSIFNTCFIVV